MAGRRVRVQLAGARAWARLTGGVQARDCEGPAREGGDCEPGARGGRDRRERARVEAAGGAAAVRQGRWTVG